MASVIRKQSGPYESRLRLIRVGRPADPVTSAPDGDGTGGSHVHVTALAQTGVRRLRCPDQDGPLSNERDGRVTALG